MFFITKILVVGSSTRAVSKSLKQLGYMVYATSFFDVVDQHPYVDKYLVPEKVDSFDLTVLEDLALRYVDEVDYIIFTSDVKTERFPKSKIIGNYKTESINNKYDLYKKLHKNFLLPDTYKLNSIDEAFEISNNYSDKKFLVKPINGSGGIDINWFSKDIVFDDDFILQEYITGTPISSSFLSYPNHDIEFLSTSEQIIGSAKLGGSNFLYCGNITPYVNSNSKVNNISRKISRMCKLVGSNGVDFVLHNNNVYVIEVNPRIQGTFECVENIYDINLAAMHIDSFNDKQIKSQKVKQFCVKLIPYSVINARYDLTNINNLHDISNKDSIIKKGHPITTILTADRILENAMIKAELIQKQVYNSLL